MSTAPVLVVPADENTMNGFNPAARSAAIARSNSSTRILKSPSTPTVRTRSCAIPASFAAFTMQWCACDDTYNVPERISSPRCFSRAQAIALNIAIEPPVVNNPRVVAGNCIQSRSHSSTFASSCTSAGAACQIPVYRLVALAMKSANAAG